MARWPDVQQLAVAYLTAAPGPQWSTRSPADVRRPARCVRVTRGPGTDDGITDSPLLDVETFARHRAATPGTSPRTPGRRCTRSPGRPSTAPWSTSDHGQPHPRRDYGTPPSTGRRVLPAALRKQP